MVFEIGTRAKPKHRNKTNLIVQPTMIVVTFTCWILLNAHYAPQYFRIVTAFPEAGVVTTVMITLSWIILTSLYACFHVVSFLFSLAVTKLGRPAARTYETTPHVAMLYLCMNDMKEDAVKACLSQDYLNYALYILDDSTVSEEIARVDRLNRANGAKLTIIRREQRGGFKAGNLNHGLRKITARHEYVCVVDADEMMGPTFLREMVAVAEANRHYAFVQAAHRLYAGTLYGDLTGNAIPLHWDYFLPARNLFGFVYSYGHGVLFRTMALEAVGGFPEVVAEDIAISAKLREIGYRGYFAHDIVSYEETPPTYRSFRKRNEKVVSGTLEFLSRICVGFLRARSVSFVEKIDLLLASSLIFLPVVFVLYLSLLYGAVPLISSESFGKAIQAFAPMQNLAGAVLMAFLIFAPLCYLIPEAGRSPRRVFLFVLRMGAIHLSVSLRAAFVAMKWIRTRDVAFTPTGDRVSGHLAPDHSLELTVGCGVLLLGFLAGSLNLAAVGLSLVLVPALVRDDLNRKVTRLLVCLPVMLTVAAVVGMPFTLLAATGVFAGVALAYH